MATALGFVVLTGANVGRAINSFMESLEAALRLEQYAVDWLRSGEPVRSALGATPYDLLILDLGLPGVPGTQVLRQLRGHVGI